MLFAEYGYRRYTYVITFIILNLEQLILIFPSFFFWLHWNSLFHYWLRYYHRLTLEQMVFGVRAVSPNIYICIYIHIPKFWLMIQFLMSCSWSVVFFFLFVLYVFHADFLWMNEWMNWTYTINWAHITHTHSCIVRFLIKKWKPWTMLLDSWLKLTTK